MGGDCIRVICIIISLCIVAVTFATLPLVDNITRAFRCVSMADTMSPMDALNTATVMAGLWCSETTMRHAFNIMEQIPDTLKQRQRTLDEGALLIATECHNRCRDTIIKQALALYGQEVFDTRVTTTMTARDSCRLAECQLPMLNDNA